MSSTFARLLGVLGAIFISLAPSASAFELPACAFVPPGTPADNWMAEIALLPGKNQCQSPSCAFQSEITGYEYYLKKVRGIDVRLAASFPYAYHLADVAGLALVEASRGRRANIDELKVNIGASAAEVFASSLANHGLVPEEAMPRVAAGDLLVRFAAAEAEIKRLIEELIKEAERIRRTAGPGDAPVQVGLAMQRARGRVHEIIGEFMGFNLRRSDPFTFEFDLGDGMKRYTPREFAKAALGDLRPVDVIYGLPGSGSIRTLAELEAAHAAEPKRAIKIKSYDQAQALIKDSLRRDKPVWVALTSYPGAASGGLHGVLVINVRTAGGTWADGDPITHLLLQNSWGPGRTYDVMTIEQFGFNLEQLRFYL